MFYRRKIILALLERLNGKIEGKRFQKLLFLFSRLETLSTYEFVPYKGKPYSFSAQADIDTMIKREFLEKTEEGFKILKAKSYLDELKAQDLNGLKELVKLYGAMDNTQLLAHIESKYPYYTSIPDNELSSCSVKPTPNTSAHEAVLYTIGYEGVSLENFLNNLLKHQVKLLVDVRDNARSQKFGFSKTRLKECCNAVGIDYLHTPELGIKQSKRKEATSRSDYEALFEEYRINTLSTTGAYQEKVVQQLQKYTRIALTCFEAKPEHCHRKPLAEVMQESGEVEFEICHI